MPSADIELAGRPRWRGQPGRLEVHYLTATDDATGLGLWLHHEVVAPTDGDAYAHGWLATFPRDAAPSYERFGPSPVQPTGETAWFRGGDVAMTATAATGSAGGRSWDLQWQHETAPLWTFPRWAWQRQALPAAQVVPTPSTTITGSVDGRAFSGAGATAHIYGHGNAHRWVWLHADLGGGDVLEVVAATARRPGLRLLPPLPLLQLRVDGRDWPADPLAAAALFRCRIRNDGFRIAGIVGTRRLVVDVGMLTERCVNVAYVDPDGATATCRNTERADVRVEMSDLTPRGWRRHRRWQLSATGHAEVGTRP